MSSGTVLETSITATFFPFFINIKKSLVRSEEKWREIAELFIVLIQLYCIAFASCTWGKYEEYFVRMTFSVLTSLIMLEGWKCSWVALQHPQSPDLYVFVFMLWDVLGCWVVLVHCVERISNTLIASTLLVVFPSRHTLWF